MIERAIYLKKLEDYKHKQLIKVVTGIRRCGKSTLLKLFQQRILDQGIATEQLIVLDFEDMNNSHLLNPKILHDHIIGNLHENMTYIFLDEIQQVPEFERVISSLFTRKNVDIYITGSNANMLSSELATLLSGRYVEISMLPFSLKEYASARGEYFSKQELYNEYLLTSSFPYAIELRHDYELVRGYLEGVFNTVILKDVISRNKISDAMMLDSVIRFLFDSIGSTISMKKISDTMTSMGRKISSHTVESYIQGLIDSYVLYKVKRYDVKGKQYLKTQEKYYVVDIGLRYFLLGRKKRDFGHILENIIFLELTRRGYEISIGKVDKMEIDFVVTTQEEIMYIQVALSIRNEETFNREIKVLQAVKNSYPKYILTLDEDPKANVDGIWIMNALDFLLETKTDLS